MKLRLSNSGIPVGSYTSKFLSWEETENNYGKALRWTWEITSGAHKGSHVGCVTSQNPTNKNKCGKVLSGMLGKPIPADMDIELEQFVGRPFVLIVEASEKGGTYVGNVALPV